MKYVLNSLEGNEIGNILNYGDYITNTAFDVVDREDDITVQQDGFEIAADFSEEELHQINTRLADIGLKARVKDYK